MASPRSTLLEATAECLRRIRQADGYLTDAGVAVTTEPHPLDDDETFGVGLLIDGQARATEAALVRTHRLTTLAVLVKVGVGLDDAQQRLDDVISDIERAMADQQFRFPVGITFPQYASMTPVPAKSGMRWNGAVIRYLTHIPIR